MDRYLIKRPSTSTGPTNVAKKSKKDAKQSSLKVKCDTMLKKSVYILPHYTALFGTFAALLAALFGTFHRCGAALFATKYRT